MQNRLKKQCPRSRHRRPTRRQIASPSQPSGDDAQQGNEQRPGNAFGTQQCRGYAGERTAVRRDASRTQNKKVGRRKDGKGERHGAQTTRRPQSVRWEKAQAQRYGESYTKPHVEISPERSKNKVQEQRTTDETEHRCPESNVEFQVLDKRTNRLPTGSCCIPLPVAAAPGCNEVRNPSPSSLRNGN